MHRSEAATLLLTWAVLASPACVVHHYVEGNDGPSSEALGGSTAPPRAQSIDDSGRPLRSPLPASGEGEGSPLEEVAIEETSPEGDPPGLDDAGLALEPGEESPDTEAARAVAEATAEKAGPEKPASLPPVDELRVIELTEATPEDAVDSGSPVHQSALNRPEILEESQGSPGEQAAAVKPEEAGLVFANQEDLVGTPVLDLFHQEVGQVVDLAIDLETGKVAYLVMNELSVRRPIPRDLVVWDARGRFILRVSNVELDSKEPLLVEGTQILQVFREREEPDTAVPQAAQPEGQETVRAIFKVQEPEQLAGDVTQTEFVVGNLEILLRETNNHYHRVVLGRRDYVTGQFPGIESWGSEPEGTPRRSVQLKAVQTRDQEGIFWVASSIKVGEQTLVLRNEEDGAPMWKDLGPTGEPEISTAKARRNFLSAVRFQGTTIEISEGEAKAIGKQAMLSTLDEPVALFYEIEQNGKRKRKELDMQLLEIIEDQRLRLGLPAEPEAEEPEPEPSPEGV